MNTADIIILAVLALSMLFGLMRGFVAEVISLICWIAAFWVAWMFGDTIAAWYGQWLHQPTARVVAGYLTCFLGVIAVGSLVGWAFAKLMRGGVLSGGDRFLGMLFGFARGVLLVLVVVWVLAFTPAPRETWWRTSQLLPLFVQGTGVISQHVPPDVTQTVETGVKRLPADVKQTVQTGERTLPELKRNPISLQRLERPGALAPGSSAAPPPQPKARSDRQHGDGGVGQ